MIGEFENDSAQLKEGDATAGVDATVQTDGTGSPKSGVSVSDLKIVNRLGGIPIIAESVGTFESIANSTKITASLYATAGAIGAKSIDLAQPLLTRGQPLIDKADGLANQGLDLVESRFPYPFKASSSEIVGSAKGIYDNQVAVLLHNELIQRAIDNLYQLKEKLATTTTSAAGQVQAISHGIVEQLSQLQNKELPAGVKENISTAYNDVKNIVGEQDKTTQQKATEILHYVQSKVYPEIEKLQGYLFKQKEQTKEIAGDLKADADKKTEEVADKVDEATS